MIMVCRRDTLRVIDMGNNESRAVGVACDPQGGYIALTLAQSKRFKTRRGAERWLAGRGYNPDGTLRPAR